MKVAVIAINKTFTLASRSRLESYKRLVSVSGGERLGLVSVSNRDCNPGLLFQSGISGLKNANPGIESRD